MNSAAISPSPQGQASSSISIITADYKNAQHAQVLIDLLDQYARDPAGGGAPLTDHTRKHLANELQRRPQAFSVLAFDGDQPVGLTNCIEGFSTFACKPLINVHDLVVTASHRGRRIADLMLARVESIARKRGCCKLTLEVLQGNTQALKAYARAGFEGYSLHPELGHALFLQKKLVPA